MIKFSTIEKSLNKLLFFFIFVLLSELVISTTCTMLLGWEYDTNFPWYLPGDKEVGQKYEINVWTVFHMFLLWLVLYNYIIPISMYVSIEMQKFVASKFIPWDNELYDEERNIRATCNTSDINEELGLVTHLFTDKTGTLTRNIMVFQKYSRDGLTLEKTNMKSEGWNKFLMVMALCHSVQVSDNEFIASSPDEKALLEACKEHGIVFCGTSMTGEMTVKYKSHNLTFQKLAELEFDSFRKCMSVIVKDANGNISLLTKGAETSMLPICVSGPVQATSRTVDDFASEGLRTLVLGFKTLSYEDYQAFVADLEQAKQSIVNRGKYVREVYKEMEAGLEVVGATGIEDKLQENVVETIVKLKDAGIIPWMLTGDKKETALSIAQAAGLMETHAKTIDICDISEKDTDIMIKQVLDELHAKYYSRSASLIVDGKSILQIMKSEDLKETFLKICNQCPTVVACRLSPIQKSQLVRMMKEADPTYLTAAIGDGGNDISMIQEAHVGLGVFGLEGTAASKAADFSFTKFMFLQRILFVHGHWYYRRLAFLVQYSFYKNVGCFTSQMFYAMHSNWSGQTLFESMFLFLFNTIYTLIPVLIFGLFEQDRPDHELLRRPELYRIHRGNTLMKWTQLMKWMVLGLWHSLVSYYGWFMFWNSTYSEIGDDINCLGALVAFTSVIILNLKILVESRYWTWILVISIALSIGSYLVITILYDQFLIPVMFNNFNQFRTLHRVIDDPISWLGIMLLTVMALLPDVLCKLIKPYFKKRRVTLRSLKITPKI